MTIFGAPEELLLNLQRDSMQPLFGSVRSLLVVPGMGLKLSYPFFSGPELSRQLMSRRESLLILSFGISGGPVN